MKIRCTKHGVWWNVVKDDHGDTHTYSFVYPMVIYFLKDQVGIVLPDYLAKWLVFYMQR